MNRGAFLRGVAASVTSSGGPASGFAALEAWHGGRLGVAALDSDTGARIAHRAGERFPMCSTFKVLLVAATLSRVDAGREQLDRRIFYTRSELLEYAPITRKNVAPGFMPVRALCEAAIEYSDNTAANVLLHALGGPDRVTRYARSLGDARTRLDRNEPTLNIVANVHKLLSENVLSRTSKHELESWLSACRTGNDCIRAGVPAGWRVGDKTGSGNYASRNDIAVLYPPSRAPIFVTAYYTGSSASPGARDNVLAEVGRLVSSNFA